MSSGEHIRCFLLFFFAFVLFTIIGTLSHEWGHVVTAQILGYDTELHYGFMEFNEGKNVAHSLFDELLIRAGGPLQTMITGIFGLIILIYSKRKYPDSFYWPHWLATFLSLFWLREVFNMVSSIADKILNGDLSFYGGDELHLAKLLELPHGTFAIPLALMSTLVGIYIVFVAIPKIYRINFIFAGLSGGLFGFWFWLVEFGPEIMP